MNNKIITDSLAKNNPLLKVIDVSDAKVSLDLQNIEKSNDVVLINAPLGTGKTTFIKNNVIGNPKYSKFFYLAPTKALTKTASKLFDVEFYLDKTDYSLKEISLACCGNSMRQVSLETKINVLVIDEIDQIISMLLGSTIKESDRLHIMDHFVQLIKMSDLVIIMQHDISNDVLTLIERAGKTNSTIMYNFVHKPWTDKAVYNLIGNYPAAIHFLQEKIKSEIKKGNKLVIACNSKKKVEELEILLRSLCKGLTIHSGNSDNEAQVSFFENPSETSKHYHVINISPKVTSGVSIVNESYETTFGIYINSPNTLAPDDFIQMTGRNRGAKEIFLSIQDGSDSYEEDALEIAKNTLDLNRLQAKFLEKGEEGIEILFEPYKLTWIDSINIGKKSRIAHLKNNASSSILYMLKDLGCVIQDFALTQLDKTKGIEMNKEMKAIRITESAIRVSKASNITQTEADLIKFQKLAPQDDQDKLSKFYLQKSLGIDLDDMTSEEDKRSRYVWWSEDRVHSQVANLELVGLNPRSSITKTLKSFMDSGYNPTTQNGLLFIKWGIIKELMRFFKISYDKGIITHSSETFRLADFNNTDCAKFIQANVGIVNMCGLGCKIREPGLNNKVIGLWLSKGLGLETKALNKRMGYKNAKGKDVFMRYYKIVGLKEGVEETALNRFNSSNNESKAFKVSSIKATDTQNLSVEERADLIGIKINANVKAFINQMKDLMNPQDIMDLLILSKGGQTPI